MAESVGRIRYLQKKSLLEKEAILHTQHGLLSEGGRVGERKREREKKKNGMEEGRKNGKWGFLDQ